VAMKKLILLIAILALIGCATTPKCECVCRCECPPLDDRWECFKNPDGLTVRCYPKQSVLDMPRQPIPDYSGCYELIEKAWGLGR